MIRSISVCSLFALVMCLTGGCQTTGDVAGVNAAKQNFFDSWSKAKDAKWTDTKLGNVVENSDDFLSFDGMNQSQTVITGWSKYASIWNAGMNGFVTAKLSEAKSVRTWVSGDLALTASIAHIQGELPDGKMLDMPGHLTLGWKKIDGQWKLVHEHMSLGVKE